MVWMLTLLALAVCGACQPPASKSEGSSAEQLATEENDESRTSDAADKGADGVIMPSVEEVLVPEPVTVSDDDVAKVAALVEHMETLGAVVEAEGADCVALGNAMTALVAERGESFKAAINGAKELSKDTMTALEGRFSGRLLAAQAKYSGIQKCKSDPQVAAALKQIF